MVTRVNWNIPAPKPLDEALEEAVGKVHITKSDFVRDAVRRRLEELASLQQSTYKG